MKRCSEGDAANVGEHPYRSVISKWYWNGQSDCCSPINLLPIFKAPFYKNTYGGMLLCFDDNTGDESVNPSLINVDDTWPIWT